MVSKTVGAGSIPAAPAMKKASKSLDLVAFFIEVDKESNSGAYEVSELGSNAFATWRAKRA